MSSKNQLVESVKRILDINESSLSRLWRKHQESDSGTITAFRGEYSKSENMARNAKLKAALLGAGYSVTAVDGVYIEQFGTPNAKRVKESSFIVFDQNKTGNLEKDLKKLGEKYDQDSITFNSVAQNCYYLIGTSKREDSYPGYGRKVKLGKPMFGKDGEFYSSVNGRPFVFQESVSEAFHDYDDTMRNYHTWHAQALKQVAQELLG